MRLRSLVVRSPLLAGGGLLAAAALHVAWGRGSAFPAPDRATLAEAVIGAPPATVDEERPGVPGALACYAVAGALTVAAVGINARGPVRRLIALGVVAALGARGAAGLAGLMPQETGSPTFRRWNRLLYSPLCLVLAALTLPAVVSD